jgi:hypothetical protein
MSERCARCNHYARAHVPECSAARGACDCLGFVDEASRFDAVKRSEEARLAAEVSRVTEVAEGLSDRLREAEGLLLDTLEMFDGVSLLYKPFWACDCNRNAHSVNDASDCTGKCLFGRIRKWLEEKQ